jgi:hypothetical protein
MKGIIEKDYYILKNFLLLMLLVSPSVLTNSVSAESSKPTCRSISESKIIQDSRDYQKVSQKQITIISPTDINSKRTDTNNYINTLNLPEDQKNQAKNEINSTDSLSAIDSIKNNYTNISNDNTKRQEEEKKQAEEHEKEMNGPVTFNSDGTLEYTKSDSAQEVINLLLAIPGHSNGAEYHKTWHIDEKIDNLSVKECVYVLRRIEDNGFGQTGDGLAGQETSESHHKFVENQLNKRYGGSIKNLLKKWGTYSYGGY